MGRVTYLVVVHVACVAMVLPAGVIVMALRLWMQEAFVWCSDRVSRRFVRRIVVPVQPAGSGAGEGGKLKKGKMAKGRLVVGQVVEAPIPLGKGRGVRHLIPFA